MALFTTLHTQGYPFNCFAGSILSLLRVAPICDKIQIMGNQIHVSKMCLLSNMAENSSGITVLPNITCFKMDFNTVNVLAFVM